MIILFILFVGGIVLLILEYILHLLLYYREYMLINMIKIMIEDNRHTYGTPCSSIVRLQLKKQDYNSIDRSMQFNNY